MTFEYQPNTLLPRLAWCARVQRSNSHVRVRHGPWVETKPDCFVAGAWDGDFARGKFDSAVTFLGSGARAVSDGMLFSTSCHTLDRLFMVELDNQVLISNSLGFLFAETGDSFDSEYRYYNKDMSSIKLGLRRSSRRIPTRDGRRVTLLHFSNVLIRPDLSVDIRRRPYPREFYDYEDYVNYLQDTIGTVMNNCRSEEREITYDPLATLSSGYDSSACAALVRSASDCREGVTLNKARSTFEDRDDSGAEIGRVLGLDVAEYDPDAYRKRADLPEAEFLASGAHGGDVVMTAFEDRLPGSILCTGHMGDTVWGLHPVFSDRQRARDLYPGSPALSIQEFRLRTGFLHFPIPQSHQGSRHSIHRISRSAELARWDRGTEYERPIARRILEEAGVPGELFGQSKKAASQPLNHPERLERFMSPTSWEDFQKFLQRADRSVRLFGKFRHELMGRLYHFNRRVNWRFREDPRLPMLDCLSRPVIPHKYSEFPTIVDFTFHWGLEILLKRYENALTSDTSSRDAALGEREPREARIRKQ